MQYHPPIDQRETKALLDIIEHPSKWKKEVVDLARAELSKRGIPVEQQIKRKRSTLKLAQRITSIKTNAILSTREKVLIVVFSPLTFVFLQDTSFYAGRGYRKRNIQGITCFLIGCALWIGIGIIALSLS